MYHSLKFMSFQARQTWHVKDERDYLHAAREEEGLLYSSAFSPFLQLEGFSDHIFCKSLHGTAVFYPFFNSRKWDQILVGR